MYSSARAEHQLDSPPRRLGVETDQIYSSADTANQLDSPPLRPGVETDHFIVACARGNHWIHRRGGPA